MMKIAVVGTGYVGLSMAVLLAQKHTVYAVDIINEKVCSSIERRCVKRRGVNLFDLCD